VDTPPQTTLREDTDKAEPKLLERALRVGWTRPKRHRRLARLFGNAWEENTKSTKQINCQCSSASQFCKRQRRGENMSQEKLELVETYSKEQAAKLGLHAWPHIQRVVHLCTEISKLESRNALIDSDVLKTAALLHDIAKHLEKGDGSIDHGDVGASMAEKFLQFIGFEEEKIRLVCHAIRVHTHREEPTTIEAQILHDADFLDKLGAVGIATIFIKACLTNRTIEEVVEAFEAETPKQSFVNAHIRWLKKTHLYTKTAQEIAVKRNAIVSLFFRQLKEEVEWNAQSV